jgi:hypothetical protein
VQDTEKKNTQSNIKSACTTDRQEKLVMSKQCQAQQITHAHTQNDSDHVPLMQR